MTAASERRAASISEPSDSSCSTSNHSTPTATAAGTMRSNPTAPSPTGQNECEPRDAEVLDVHERAATEQ